MIRDTRTLLVMFKDNPNAVRELGEELVKSADDGFEVIHAETRSIGQRDPIVTGLQLTLRREVA